MFGETYATALTDVLTYDAEGVGRLRQGAGAGNYSKWYKWVNLKNTTATVAGAAGSLVAYFAATGKLNERVVVDLRDADTLPYPAGVTLAAVVGTLLVDYYCWIQIKGVVTLDTAVTSGAAGTGIILTTTDKTGSVEVTGSISKRLGTSVNATTLVSLDCDF